MKKGNGSEERKEKSDEEDTPQRSLDVSVSFNIPEFTAKKSKADEFLKMSFEESDEDIDEFPTEKKEDIRLASELVCFRGSSTPISMQE